MFDYTENFKVHVKSAMRDYENLFSEKNPMPEHRALDIVNLRIILDKLYKDLNECMDAVKQKLSTFKTGWWIFKTGRSRLKKNILAVIHNYENPITYSLVMQIATMNRSLLDMSTELEQIKRGGKPSCNIQERLISSEEEELQPVKSSLFSFSLEEREETTTWVRMRK